MPVPTNTSTSRSPLSHPVTRATQIVTTRPSASATTHASTRSGRATASVRGASVDERGAVAGRAALLVSTKVSRTAAAFPDSTAAIACSIPAPMSGAASATTSAAAALSATTSRTGPGSPPSIRSAIATLAAASPPTISSASAAGIPYSPGSTVEVRTEPFVSSHTFETVVVVSSSRPSAPQNTIATSTPSSARVCAMRSAIDGSDTPRTRRRTPAGLASGPRKLNVVGVPSSRRAGPANRSAGWNFGAKQNPIPASSTQRATPVGPRSITTPIASSTSAEPHADDAARLPCLATRTPAPATTRAARVEMLTVPERSPPVPHVSTTGPPGPSSGMSTVWANRSIVRARAASSAAVSPLDRSATAKPAIWASVASPARIVAMACSACSAGRSSRRRSRPITSGQRAGMGVVMRVSARAPESIPPQIVVENPARDEPQLHLRGALDDRELLGVPVVELRQMVFHVPGGAEHLQGLSRDLHRQLGGVVLRHRQERDVLLGEQAAVGHPRGAVGEQPRGLDLGCELGDLPLDALEVGDRLTERLALLHVLDRVHQCALGEPDPAGGHDRPHRVEPEHGKAESTDLADHVLGRHAYAVEDEFAGVDTLHAHLAVDAADVDARPRALHDERAHA